MKTLAFERPRGFSLKAAAEFYAGFTPGSGMATATGQRLSLAFRLDGSFAAVVAELEEQGDRIIAEVCGSADTSSQASSPPPNLHLMTRQPGA